MKPSRILIDTAFWQERPDPPFRPGVQARFWVGLAFHEGILGGAIGFLWVQG